MINKIRTYFWYTIPGKPELVETEKVLEYLAIMEHNKRILDDYEHIFYTNHASERTTKVLNALGIEVKNYSELRTIDPERIDKIDPKNFKVGDLIWYGDFVDYGKQTISELTNSICADLDSVNRRKLTEDEFNFEGHQSKPWAYFSGSAESSNATEQQINIPSLIEDRTSSSYSVHKPCNKEDIITVGEAQLLTTSEISEIKKQKDGEVTLLKKI